MVTLTSSGVGGLAVLALSMSSPSVSTGSMPPLYRYALWPRFLTCSCGVKAQPSPPPPARGGPRPIIVIMLTFRVCNCPS
jgi:hypothetical protein